MQAPTPVPDDKYLSPPSVEAARKPVKYQNNFWPEALIAVGIVLSILAIPLALAAFLSFNYLVWTVAPLAYAVCCAPMVAGFGMQLHRQGQPWKLAFLALFPPTVFYLLYLVRVRKPVTKIFESASNYPRFNEQIVDFEREDPTTPAMKG